MGSNDSPNLNFSDIPVDSRTDSCLQGFVYFRCNYRRLYQVLHIIRFALGVYRIDIADKEGVKSLNRYEGKALFDSKCHSCCIGDFVSHITTRRPYSDIH